MLPGTFSVISGSRPDSVGGGGVVAEIFRDLPKRNTFAGGGGGENQSNSLNSGRFFYISN